MNRKHENFPRENIVGVGKQSDQEIFSSVLKHWRKRIGYCSIVAAVPALLASHLPAARSEGADKPKPIVPRPAPRILDQLNITANKRALLKRQSSFRLPHQKGAADTSSPVASADQCPGRVIPGGAYTASAPFVTSGDTTDADDTVTAVPSYYYYNYSAQGPDHIYSFTLTGRGSNPEIDVSTTSAAYRPMVYVLIGDNGGCPAGTANFARNATFVDDSRWGSRNAVSLNNWAVNHLPLNVPIYLFVDSSLNDAQGAGPYTVRMQDVTVGCSNSIDCTDFFVRQQYRDFLNREPDADGFNFWMNQIMRCGADPQCVDAMRINDSGAFFLSVEFQESGYLVYRFNKAAYGNLPGAPVPMRLSDFLPDAQQVGKDVVVNQAGWQSVLENNKQAFAGAFVQRPQFVATYATSLSPESYVDTLFANTGVTPTADDRTAAINEFGGATNTGDIAARGRALRRVAENSTLRQQEFNRAFVLMQYFGYLRRNPNDAPDNNFDGYNFWLDKLNSFNGDFNQAEMVKAFIASTEYRKRFGL